MKARKSILRGERVTIPLLVAGMIGALSLALLWSPVDVRLGIVQKIFYFHVASAWNAFLAFFVVFVMSILYLWRRNRAFDIVAGVSAEIGLLFTTIVLVTGSIWGRSSWNVWWSWEPRLTTSLILWFMYAAYLMIRSSAVSWEKRARLSSVFGIIAFVDVPIVFMSIRWWRSKLHPVVFGSGAGRSGGGVDPRMLLTLLFCVAVFSLLYFVLLNRGIRTRKLGIEIDTIKRTLFERTGWGA